MKAQISSALLIVFKARVPIALELVAWFPSKRFLEQLATWLDH